MEEAVERTIILLTEQVTRGLRSDDALRFTQAALNLQHVLAVKASIEIERNKQK